MGPYVWRDGGRPRGLYEEAGSVGGHHQRQSAATFARMPRPEPTLESWMAQYGSLKEKVIELGIIDGRPLQKELASPPL
jgi:hypothetical protein